MMIDSMKYNGSCRCGRYHEMATKLVIVKSGCLTEFDGYMSQVGLQGWWTAVYDENTYAAKGLVRPVAKQEIVLPPQNLHADERSTRSVLSQLNEDTRVLIAVGSGTIHDIVRYCATERGIPFVSCPTAASVDGFCSTVSAMTWNGFKKTMPGKAPVMVLADTAVISQAPLYLALSGVGDILGKYTALLDWNIAHLLTAEPVCPQIEDMTRQSVHTVHESCRKVAQRDELAFEDLTYALLMSGLAMQMMGNSRPASGAEHHISHFIEMEPVGVKLHSMALHGEKVGVGTVLASREYHRLAQIRDIRPLLHSYTPASEQELGKVFGAALLPSVMAENENSSLSDVTLDILAQCWPDICALIEQLPTAEELESLLAEIGAKHTLNDIEVAEDLLPPLLEYSPYVRNRLTFMRVRQMLRLKD